MRGLLDRFTKPGANGDEVAELLEDPTSRTYAAESVRPWMLLGSRALLWGAVAIGAAGGMVGCLAKTQKPATPVVVAEPDPGLVPPQVTSSAEHIVERWLMATNDDEEDMAELFVEPPDLPADLAGRYVIDVRTVASLLVGERYWSVTVAAEMEQVVETEPTDESAPVGGTGETGETGDSGEDGGENGTSGPFTWYIEVGIVGDPRTGLRAHRTPAIMPPPPPVEDTRSSTSEPWRPADQDDDLVQTIDGFLDALLAGEGDPDRYFLDELDIRPIDPAPLDDVHVEEIAVQELPDDAGMRVEVKVVGTTTDGEGQQPLAYEFDVRWNGQEYEILRHWGSATLVG